MLPSTSPGTAGEFQSLELRLKTLLPESYRETYEEVRPVSMGSAGLKYGADGKVAWDQIWGSFCDLAMAGGPPHKGTLLEPSSRQEIEAAPALYDGVVSEICRGISLVTGLCAETSPAPGWIRLYCTGAVMAGWLARAIAMENISVAVDGLTLYLPAGPHYRLEKEIKNVITSVAKTSHYWTEHTPAEQQDAIAVLFRELNAASPLLQPMPFRPEWQAALAEELSSGIANSLTVSIGFPASAHSYIGWLGLDCGAVEIAIRMMRLVMTQNLLTRRESTTLFLPVDPINDPEGSLVVRATLRAHRYLTAETSINESCE